MEDKWGERWVRGIELARLSHIVLAGFGYLVLILLVFGYVLQYCY